MLILYFEKLTFGVIISWSGRKFGGSCQTELQKMDGWNLCSDLLSLPSGSAINSRMRTSIKLSTVDGRAVSAAAPRIWNSLPNDIISAPILPSFRQLLKTFLFRQSLLHITFCDCFQLSLY